MGYFNRDFEPALPKKKFVAGKLTYATMGMFNRNTEAVLLKEIQLIEWGAFRLVYEKTFLEDENWGYIEKTSKVQFRTEK